jgi:hypothetical protein
MTSVSMAHIEFEIIVMMDARLDVVKMIGVLQQSRQVGRQHTYGWAFGNDRQFSLCVSVYFKFDPLNKKIEIYSR